MKLARNLTKGDRISFGERAFEVESVLVTSVPATVIVDGYYLGGDGKRESFVTGLTEKFREVHW